MPARAFAASIFRQRAGIAPEAAIFSTWAGVFRISSGDPLEVHP